MKAFKIAMRDMIWLGLFSLTLTVVAYAGEFKDEGTQVLKHQTFEQALMSKDIDAAASFFNENHFGKKTAENNEQIIEAAIKLYRLSVVMMSYQDKYEEQILTQLEQAEMLLDRITRDEAKSERSGASLSSIQEPNFLAQANALMSGIIGLRIGISPWKGIFLGSKSSSYLARAIKAAPDDHVVIWMNAVRYHRTPASFGGDIEKARTQYAILAFSTDTQSKPFDWLQKEALRSYCSLAKNDGVPESCAEQTNTQSVF